jgi:hypothetical protein
LVAHLVRDEGDRRFKSCHSDQHLADFLDALPTETFLKNLKVGYELNRQKAAEQWRARKSAKRA